MVRVVRAGCLQLGLLWWILCAARVAGIIEIVEEQQCHDHRFQLTCRDLLTHIAVLEAWYTSVEDYRQNITYNQTEPRKIHTENDSELNQVFLYSSPKHNGIYEPVNTQINNVTQWPSWNESKLVNDSVLLNESFVDISDWYVNDTECGVNGFLKSYASWNEGGRRRLPVLRETSVNLRAPVSYRCAGVNHCSFILSEDYPASERWLPGLVYIKYACFDDTTSVHYCNKEVKIEASGPDSEGYIRSPGYPHFYIGDECRWRLVVAAEQRIRVTFVDVSLRSIGPFETECTDYVIVEDSNGQTLLSSCDQVELPLQITTATNSVDIIVQANSKGAFPKRGVLIHYKSISCVTLAAPSNGYLVYRNEDVAHYMCNINYVFADTRERARLIWCYEDNRWNDSVPFCVEEATLRVVEDTSTNSTQRDTKLPSNEPNMIVDIVIPSLLIAALFIGNAFIVLIIYKYRKRKSDDCEDEINTIPLSANGNVHTAGNAV